MALPIMPTPVLKGKAAERFIKKLEAEKELPLPVRPFTQKTDLEAIRAIMDGTGQHKEQKLN